MLVSKYVIIFIVGKKKELKSFSTVSNAKWFIIVIAIILMVIVIYILNRKSTPLSQIYTIRTPTPRSTLNINIFTPPTADQSQKFHEELAISDLSNKLNIAKDIIKVVEVEPVEFSDTSLGCPERNNMYAQVITPGFIVNLEVLGEIYTYNAGLNRVVSCKRN